MPHPRRTRLGLIEAAACGFFALVSCAGIRGARASASLKLDAGATGVAGVAGIRGARASASLKPYERTARRSRHARRIRGARASASLKPVNRRIDRPHRPMHPRRTRLGLIEAGPISSAVACALGSIRGARASASLKRDEGIGGHHRVPPSIRGARASASLKQCRTLRHVAPGPTAHPRRTRLGLIEALRLRPGRVAEARQASEAHAPRPH